MPIVCREVPNRSQESRRKRLFNANDAGRVARYAQDSGTSDLVILMEIARRMDGDFIVIERPSDSVKACVAELGVFLTDLGFALDGLGRATRLPIFSMIRRFPIIGIGMELLIEWINRLRDQVPCMITVVTYVDRLDRGDFGG